MSEIALLVAPTLACKNSSSASFGALRHRTRLVPHANGPANAQLELEPGSILVLEQRVHEQHGKVEGKDKEDNGDPRDHDYP